MNQLDSSPQQSKQPTREALWHMDRIGKPTPAIISIRSYNPEDTKKKINLTIASLRETTQRWDVDKNPTRSEDEILKELREKYLPKLEEFRNQVLEYQFPPQGEVQVHLTHPQNLFDLYLILHERLSGNITTSSKAGYSFHITYKDVEILKTTLAELLDPNGL
jgi:hypothetical protein